MQWRRRREKSQDSVEELLSSMAMSRNSLASKISPHSRHSTNSASSSRATICTRGCLHSGMSLLFSGNSDGGIGFIDPGCFPARAGRDEICRNLCGILDRLLDLSSLKVQYLAHSGLP